MCEGARLQSLGIPPSGGRCVKGHDFSRANKTHKKDPGLSPRKISYQAQPADALYQGTASQFGNNSTGNRCAKGLDFRAWEYLHSAADV